MTMTSFPGGREELEVGANTHGPRDQAVVPFWILLESGSEPLPPHCWLGLSPGPHPRVTLQVAHAPARCCTSLPVTSPGCPPNSDRKSVPPPRTLPSLSFPICKAEVSPRPLLSQAQMTEARSPKGLSCGVLGHSVPSGSLGSSSQCLSRSF